MKKLIALLLSMLLVFSMAACGTDDSASDRDDPDEKISTKADADEDAVDNDDSTSDKDDKENDNGFFHTDEIDFEEITVVDNDFCTIKITSIDPDNMWGYTLDAYLENKTSDKHMMFSIDDATINGVACDPFFVSDVIAGSKSNNEINFSIDDLPKEITENISDICMIFNVYDYDDYSAEAYAYETVHVYPFGEDAAEQFTREAQDDDTVLVDNEYATIICTGFGYDDIWGYAMNLYCVNKTDVNIMFSMDDVTVNGFMADPFFASGLMANSCSFEEVCWSDETFEINGITDVEEITFNLRGYNNDDWLADDFFNEGIVVNP